MPSITDWSQVSDAGLVHAESFLPASDVAHWKAVIYNPRLPDPFQQAVAAKLVPNTQAGSDLFQLVYHSPGVLDPAPAGRMSFLQAIRQYPQLAGLSEARALYASTDGAPDDVVAMFHNKAALLSIAHNPNAISGVFESGLGLPIGITAGDAALYLQWVDTYLGQIFDSIPTLTGQERNNYAAAIVPLARQAALAHGATTLGEPPFQWPTSLVHYRVTLPDGVEFAVLDDVTGDPANRSVVKWFGPSYRPAQYASQIERDGATICTGAVKGTGNWYEAGAFGLMGHGDSCDTTPDGFNGDYSLITADIAAALSYQNGAPVVLVQTPPRQQGTNNGGPTIQSTPPDYQGGTSGPTTPGAPVTYQLDPAQAPVLLAPAPGSPVAPIPATPGAVSPWAIAAAVATMIGVAFAIWHSAKEGK